MIVKPTAEGVMKAAQRAAKGRGPAPVHLWDPPFCGDLDMRIARDGTWFYLGTPIGRPALVQLFSNILKREGDRYFLVTPVEKVGIAVDDAPFLAVDFAVSGAGRDRVVTFATRGDERAPCGPDHPLRVQRDPATDEPAPYVLMRPGLEARIDRKSFYRLVDLCTHEERDGARWFGLWSGGAFFPVAPSDEIEAALG
ncbi:MAG: DUF1285 domain-containing protein [Paracoccaceae bacterium]|nr:MAG: DUF1285 domain-containing protein [Paracoccaceae bacterium]